MSARNTASILQMLASGLQGGMEGYQLGQQWNEQARQRQAQDRQIRQQDEDRTRQLQQNRLSLLSKLAEGQRSGNWDADFSKQAWEQAGYDPMTKTIQQPRQEYIGQVEATRKDPKMLGPMPAVKGFKTVQEQRQSDLFDTITPEDKLVTVNGALVNSRSGQVVYQAPPKPAPVQKPQMGWIPKPNGTKVWGELKPGTVAAPEAKAPPDPDVIAEREEKRRERLEANLRKRAESLIPKIVPSQYLDPMDYEQAIAKRNAAVETVFNGLLHQNTTRGQKPVKATPAPPKKSSLVETLKAGGLL